MSLNKLTVSTDYLQKQYLNIGCNQIRCSSLLVKGVLAQASYFGSYIPTITVNDGSTIQNPIGLYSYTGSSLGAQLDINIRCEMTVATSDAGYTFTINLPDNLKGYINQKVCVVGYIHNIGGAYSNYIANEANTVGNSNTFTVYFNETTATQLPVGVGGNTVNFNVKLFVKE